MGRIYLDTQAPRFFVASGGSDDQPATPTPGTFATGTGCYRWLLRYADCGFAIPDIFIQGERPGIRLEGNLLGAAMKGCTVTLDQNARLHGTAVGPGAGNGAGAEGLWAGYDAVVTVSGHGTLQSDTSDCVRSTFGATVSLAGNRAGGNDLSLGNAGVPGQGGSHLFCGEGVGTISTPENTEIWIGGDSDYAISVAGGILDADPRFLLWSGPSGGRTFREATVTADVHGTLWGADSIIWDMNNLGTLGVTSPWRCIVDNLALVLNTGGKLDLFPGGNLPPPGGVHGIDWGDVKIGPGGGVYSSQ
jgi:hypothetical protein